MEKSEIFKEIRSVLSDLFPNDNVARILIHDAGLNPDRISFNGSAIEIWFEILTEAERQNKVHSLLNAAFEHYPGNTSLHSVCDKYSNWAIYQQEESRKKLAQILRTEKITKETLVTDETISVLREEIKITIAEVLKEILSLEKDAGSDKEALDDPTLHLEMAKGFSLSAQWLKAAEYYNRYIEYFPDDWQIHFFRGVAYQNSRQSYHTNLEALRAYNEAIVYIPKDMDINIRARLFTYRAAVSKRLNKLDEAESDLLLAQEYATADYEVHDIKYNLAAVYALKGERSKMLKKIEELHKRPNKLLNIRLHLDDYFAAYSNDQEFLNAIGLDIHPVEPSRQVEDKSYSAIFEDNNNYER
ncbi:hypothetical protein KFU94_01410 [Chloroflexi bacterium TSY]|nr:hypothetical protein [Chloroflexi bacterium TSY]